MLEGGCEGCTLHCVSVGHHYGLVCRNVTKCVSERLVVLGDGHDHRTCSACEIHRDRVGTECCCFDGVCVEHVNVELLDNCIGGCCCDRGQSCIVGCGCCDTCRGDFDEQEFSTVEAFDLSVVAFFNRDVLFDFCFDCVDVSKDIKVKFASEDLLVLADLTRLQTILHAAEVDCNRTFRVVNNFLDCRVYKRADPLKGYITP